MPEVGDDEKWSVPGSDEESDSPTKTDYSPPPKEIISLYEALDSGEPLPVKWMWPYGRRPPSHSSNIIEEEYEEMLETNGPEEKSDFDFTDEATTPVLRKERQSGPKGSAKKKTTSFSGVLSNIRRFRQQERLEKEQSLQIRTKR